MTRDEMAFELYKGALMVALAKGAEFFGDLEAARATTRADSLLKALGTPQTLSGVPKCPDCGAPMIKRKRRDTQEPFWGCRKFPKCTGIRPMEELLCYTDEALQKEPLRVGQPDPDDFDADDIPF